MPTIYDILPTLNQSLIDELQTFLKADDGQFYLWEISVFVPAVNLFIHYLAGVNESLKNDNYISTTANLRGLIESLAVVVYEGTAKLPKEAYEEYMEKGRLPIWNESKKRWRKVNNTDLINYFEQHTQLKVKHVYDHCCDMLHFSSKHMSLMKGPDSKKNGQATIVIGSTDEIPVSKQREFIDFCADACTLLGQCIRLATKEKEARNTS